MLCQRGFACDFDYQGFVEFEDHDRNSRVKHFAIGQKIDNTFRETEILVQKGF